MKKYKQIRVLSDGLYSKLSKLSKINPFKYLNTSIQLRHVEISLMDELHEDQ
jgi:hypothetical protein